MFCGRANEHTTELAKKLLKYVQTNNSKSINKILSHTTSDLLSFEYTAYDRQTILNLACNDQHGTEGVTSTTIETLINAGAQCTRRDKADQWEALHYTALNANISKMRVIVKNINAQQLNSLVFCSKHMTRKYKTSRTTKLGKTYSNNALSMLLKYANRHRDFYECCEYLIEAGINVHELDSNGVSPLDLMKAMNDDRMDKVINQVPEQQHAQTVFDLIKLKDEEQFLAADIVPGIDDFDGAEEQLSSCSLMQLCCFKGLVLSVQHLLNQGVSPNVTISNNKKSPIMIAINENHVDVVKLLLESPQLKLPQDILLKLLMKYKYIKNFANTDKYANMIFQHLRQQYNKNDLTQFLLTSDDLQRNALHYATQYRCTDNILKLLSMGAPLTKKDLFGQTPLDLIEPKVLESFLDSCVNVPKTEDELNNVLYSLHNKKHAFYIEINYDSLIDLSAKHDTQESEFLNHMIRLHNMRHLLDHPVVASYLALKWQKFKWVIYTNIFLYIVAYVALLFYGFAFTQLARASNTVLLTAFVLFSFREVGQILIFRRHYLTRLENIIDLLLIIGIIFILAYGWIENFLNQNLLVAYSVVFLTSTLGIFVHLATLPLFTVQVILFKQICLNFFKYMLFYMFPLLAFFFCFYMLQENKDDLFFQTLYDTIILATGDFDSGYPQQFVTNPVFSHIVYVIFVVIIGIILQNLLIGLAVNDLQEIAKEAKFIDKKERAKYITNIERIIFKKYKHASNEISRKIFRKWLSLSDVFDPDLDSILVIQPYNKGCVFLKGSDGGKQYIKDPATLNYLENIFKNATLQDQEAKEPYSLKALHEKFQKMELFLEKLSKALNLEISF